MIGEGGLDPEAEDPVVLPLANLLKEWHSEGGSIGGSIVLLFGGGGWCSLTISG